MRFDKKIIYYIAAGLGLIILIIIAFFYLNSGTIKINTAAGNEVLIINSKGGTLNKRVVGKGDTSLRYSPGKYSILVRNNTSETQITIVLNRFQQKTYNIELVNPNQDKLIARINAGSLQANPTNLNFVEETFQQLESYNLSNKLMNSFTGREINNVFKVRWTSENQGLVTLVGGYTFFISKDGQKQFRVPDSLLLSDEVETPDFDIVNAANNILIVRVNNKIYSYDIKQDKFSEIISGLDNADKKVLITSLTDNNLLAYSIVDSVDLVDTEVSSKNYDINIIDLNNPNNKTLIKRGSEINNLKWSKNNNQLIISTNQSIEVYDYSSKTTQLVLPYRTENEKALKWTSENDLIYYSDNSLWKYNVKSMVSNKVSTNANTKYIKEAVISTDGKYYYYVIPTSNKLGTVGSIYNIPSN